MGTWATGKYAQRISDRSGMAFPYLEMVQEWTGAWVHISEYTPKQPQLNPPYHRADAVALQHPKPQKKSGILVDLGPQYWPGQFYTTNHISVNNSGVVTGATSMMPAESPSAMNKTRQVKTKLGTVTVAIT